MEIESIEDLLEVIEKSIYHHYYSELADNLPLIERCIRRFEAAASELKFQRDRIIREKNAPISKDSFDASYCNRQRVEEILGISKAKLETLINKKDITPYRDTPGGKRRFSIAEVLQYRDNPLNK